LQINGETGFKKRVSVKEVKSHFLLQVTDVRVFLQQLLKFVFGQVCFPAFFAFNDFCPDVNGVIL